MKAIHRVPRRTRCGLTPRCVSLSLCLVGSILLASVPVRASDALTPETIGDLMPVQEWETGVPVFSLAFSRDGSLLYGAHGNAVSVWDVEQATRVDTWIAHPGYAAGLSLSPDGTRVATAGDDATVRIWDAHTGDLLQEHAPAGTHVAVFSHDGTMIASADTHGRLWVWDATSGDLVFETTTASGVFSVAFSPDDSKLVSAHGRPDFAVRVWSIAEHSLLWEAFEHEADVHVVDVSPDGALLASASADQTVILWDIETGEAVRTLRGHSQPLFALRFIGETMLASGDGAGTVRIWDVGTGRVLRFLREHRNQVCALAISADGSTLSTASFDMEIILWRVP